VRAAERSLEQANAAYGSARDDSLIHDTRLPIVKDGVLRLLRFTGTGDGAVKGLVVQWN
jgi:hypothetical protein